MPVWGLSTDSGVTLRIRDATAPCLAALDAPLALYATEMP